MQTMIVQMAVEQLMPYREYDRLSKPAPRIPFIQQYTMSEIISWVSENGIVQPLELSVFETTALLTDGNHRLAAANLLGIKTVPVRVVYYESREELGETFYDHTIQRFKIVA